jgi:hypothetical protein
MPWTCFSYEADAPPRIGHRDVAESAPSGPRMMVTSHCFGYGADVPPGTGTRGAAQPDPSGPRRMTNSACFSY